MRTLTELYESEAARLGYEADPAQRLALAKLEELRSRLLAHKPATGLIGSLLKRNRSLVPERGLYMWGGVGRGKTWLMDLFLASLPFKDKQRSHFHRFMHAVHDDLKKLGYRENPLELVAERTARHTRVLCFDEFFVADIADAMLLGTLFDALFRRGVTLVATSNVPPQSLYKDGLQRARFLPAIQLIEQHTEVINVDGGTDYRLRTLEHATTWFDAGAPDTGKRMEQLYTAIAGEPGHAHQSLTVEHRKLQVYRLSGDVAWFEFRQLCDGPRGQNDYIELARCYHTVFLSNIPVLDAEHENQSRRFIALVDEFYDRSVKLIISAAAPLAILYRGTRLSFEFERTRSRLIEMQSQQYLARPHKP